MYKIGNVNNMDFNFDGEADLIYCDYVYESLDFSWATKYWEYLKNGGIFICQTDWHSFAEITIHMKNLGAKLISHSAWKNEWGNHPSRIYHQCFDDILFFTNNEKLYKFYPERIQVDKVTKNKGLNPSGRTTKNATAWIDDICLTTTSKERVKKEDGHLIRWQKPQKLYDRIILPFTDEEDLILDPFMGSGSLGCWSIKNYRDYVGLENDYDVFKLAQKNISLEISLIENAEVYKQLAFV
jgi:DNA modification methylase